MKATPKQWGEAGSFASDTRACLLELRARVEALEVGRSMTDLLTRLLALAELAVSEALEFDYGDPEDRHIWRELQELKALVQQSLKP